MIDISGIDDERERERILRAAEDIRAKHRSTIIISTAHVNARASMDSTPVISSLQHDATLRHEIASNLYDWIYDTIENVNRRKKTFSNDYLE